MGIKLKSLLDLEEEAEHSAVGNVILDKFFNKLEENCIIEKPAKLEGRNMIMILAPKKA